jgi:phosphoserine aminotransferase
MPEAKLLEAKAKLLYDAIDASKFYSCPVERESRSRMNVVFRVAGGDEAAEKRALAILQRCGARSVHIHRVEREWGLKDRPLHDRQLDPFLLERDPKAG